MGKRSAIHMSSPFDSNCDAKPTSVLSRNVRTKSHPNDKDQQVKTVDVQKSTPQLLDVCAMYIMKMIDAGLPADHNTLYRFGPSCIPRVSVPTYFQRYVCL